MKFVYLRLKPMFFLIQWSYDITPPIQSIFSALVVFNILNMPFLTINSPKNTCLCITYCYHQR